MNEPISVYVHIPFCTVKCGYCDFNAYAGMDDLKLGYGEALVAETRAWAPVLAGRDVASVAFGGGTPGEFPVFGIAHVLEAVAEAAPLRDGCEVSLEANPGTTSIEQLHDLRAAGVTRISFGVQGFDADELHFLDRIHSPEAAKACIPMARSAGFGDIGLDLIYGIPGQTMAAWQRNLRTAISLAPDHLSCYCLTVEEGTPLAAKVESGRVEPADVDLTADMYDAAAAILGEHGFAQYELSNWARPGHASRHNSGYWTDREYIGIGAGAHGYVAGRRYANVAHPRRYIAALSRQVLAPAPPMPPAADAFEPRDPATEMSDWVALRLRLVDGFDPASFAERFGVELGEAVGPVMDISRDDGLLERDDPIRLTVRGRQLHSEVAVRLLLHLRGAPEAANTE